MNRRVRRPLFRKYVALFVAVVSVALLINGGLEIWFSYQEHKDALIRIQREQADAAAAKIGQFVKEIESQLGWTTQLPWSASTIEQRRFDGLRLLRQVPAITELSMVDSSGKEQLRVSRLAMDVIGSAADFSKDPKFTEAVAKKAYYGPVYFRRESEPYMTLSLAGTRRDAGVSIAEVNLKLIWEVISKIKVGQHGYAYVIDAQGRLIAHPDISLVLRNTDLTGLQQVKSARAEAGVPETVQVANNTQGQRVLTANAPVPPLGWLVFVEMPVDEAYAPLYGSIQRTAVVMLGALFLAALSGMFLARRMVVPVQTLRAGAARLGGGDLSQRIEVRTGDEVEELAHEFNEMAGRLQDSYATLENKVELRTRELSEALARQTATAEVLQAISRSTFDLDTVLNTLVQSAARLCEADTATMTKQKDGRFYRAAIYGFPGDFAEKMKTIPVEPDRGTVNGRTLQQGRIVQIEDVTADPEYEWSEAQRAGGLRTLMGVPLLRGGAVIGAMSLGRGEVKPFTESQIELVTTFADQAVIAIENVRLFEEVQARTRELQESLEYQTATGEVLNVISRSPNDLKPVLQSIAETASRLCEAYDAVIVLREGEWLRPAAHAGPIEVGFEKKPVARTWVSGRAVVDRQPIHFHDFAARPEEFPDSMPMNLPLGIRTILSIPLLRDDAAIGAITIRRTEVRSFSDKQISVLQTFADQAVIAISNVRLFEEVQARTRELQESLEYQTATSEVLGVISRSPSKIAPVLETVVRTAADLCEAYDAAIFLRDESWLRLTAHHGPIPLPIPGWQISRAWVTGRAVIERRPLQVEDLQATGDEFPEGYEMALRDGHRTVLACPLLRQDDAIGAIVLRRHEVRPFTDKQVAVLQTFADQAVIAIENARLFEEVQARTRELARSVEELRALAHVTSAVNSTLDLETVLSTIVETAVHLSGTDAGAIYVYSNRRQRFRLRATFGMSDDLVQGIRSHAGELGGTALGAAVTKREPLQISDLSGETPSPVTDLILAAGYRSLLIIPLLRPGQVVGALVVRRREPGEFAESVIHLLTTFAEQSVLAIQNARLFSEIDEKSRELELASQHKSQFLANMSHELRTPMNSVLGFTEMLADGLYGPLPEKAKAALSKVQTNGKHLLGLINDVLDLSKIEAGQLTLALDDYSLKQVVQSVASTTESLAKAKGVALTASCPDALPMGYGDERRITQVVLNLVGNAIKFTDAGSVSISATVLDSSFKISVRDTGPGIPLDQRTRIFEEFQQVDDSSTRKKGGTGLGLAISKRIIEMHGGSIDVDSEMGVGSVFRVTLPVRAQDTREAA